MPQIKQLSRVVDKIKPMHVNWYPGHMFAGMQAMIGKLNTVDCIVEVHDARIPFTGRNTEFAQHLGLIKPRLLILNKRDLAELSKWDTIKERLAQSGDENVILTDLSGTDFSFSQRGYNRIVQRIMDLINNSDRHNRQTINHFKIMIVGIPNVGKSTLINRLRQQHLGRKGEPAKCGPMAGVTRSVENMIKICSRPPIYSIDTPGVLTPGTIKNKRKAMALALCSTINDAVLDCEELARYLLQYLNKNQNYSYVSQFGLEQPVDSLEDFIKYAKIGEETDGEEKKPNAYQVCWKLIKDFRRGCNGLVMFD